jgi:uncharacterized membrane protein
MKKLSYLLPLLLVVPLFAAAQGTVGESLGGWLGQVVNFINGVVVPFVFAIAFLVFIWGVIQTFIIGGQDEEKQKSGRQLMLYAIIAFVVILAFWGIINMLVSATGLGGQNLEDVPHFPVPGDPTGGGGPPGGI